MKKFLPVLIILLGGFTNSFSQLYQGPATGSVPNGVTVSTDNFLGILSPNPLPPTVRLPLRNKIPIEKLPDGMNKTLPSAPEGSNFFSDPGADNLSEVEPVLVKSFQGFNDPGNYIPPDQYIAAGPTHIMAVDNNRFRIFSKDGRLIKNVVIDYWFAQTVSSVSPFDPKVSYDHFAKRWIMVWLNVNETTQKSYFLLSVSDDSIPTGTWYNWALPSNVNGSTPINSWGDYEGVGFDDKAIYITANQFGFGSYFQGSKIRIIEKSQLYNNTAGQVVWTDLWDIREPNNLSARTFGIRPSIHLTAANDFYLMCHAPYQTGTFFSLYKISNPVTNPVMTAVNVPVTQYTAPPQANQLGGGTPLIESGDVALRFEPVYKNGFIWCTHQVRNAPGSPYSSVRYLKISTSSNTTAEDVAMGADGYWHYYPALTVDKDNNIAITYSRSGVNEYIGAYYTTRTTSMPPGVLSGSKILQTGKNNYIKHFGSGRNRWGDYNGIWIDPADENNFWMISQYAEKTFNTWASWIGMVRLIPFSGKYLSLSIDTLNFGTYEINTTSDTLKFIIHNFGLDTLSISGFSASNNQFEIINNTLPVKLGFNQSTEVKSLFKPTEPGNYLDSVRINSNSSPKSIYLKSKSYKINPGISGYMYGITGSQSSGAFLKINDSTGIGTQIGLSGFQDIRSITIRKSDNIIFGCIPGTGSSKLVRINANEGDAYITYDVPVSNLFSVAFDDNELYCATNTGILYKYDVNTGDTDLVGNTGINNLYGMSVNPLNGQLWGVSLNNKIFRIDKLTAASTLAGIPGFSLTPSITFDDKGNLFGISGLGSQVGTLIKYDTAAGTATAIGSTGFKAVNGITIIPEKIITVPVNFALYQNYPNPFNPSTKIKVDLPVNSNVNITVFDILGRVVKVLVNSAYSAGIYEFEFTAENLSSGIYFYRLKTPAFTDYKKMVFVR